jgi:hypothetical protein
MLRILVLLLCLAPALPAAATPYDLREIKLGASESEVKRRLPSAHCKAIEWQSKAADRRCDDSRVALGGVEVQVTLYLKKDAVEAFDVRFDTKELERLVKYLKTRYGKPTTEITDTFARNEKATRKVYKVLWEDAGERAVLTAQLEKRRASMIVYRGAFEEEIYRVQ